MSEAADTVKMERDRAETELAIRRARELDDKHADWERFRANDAAEALRNGIYVFDQDVNVDSVRECIADLDHLSRRSPDLPLRLIFNSPGGSVFSGMALFDFIQELRARGHHVTTVGLGWSASMAGILLAGAGDHRIIGPNAWLMIHEPSSVGVGKVSEIQDEAKFLRRVADRCLRILAERSTLTEKQIAAKWDRKDWWLDCDEALALGFVDEIAPVPAFRGPLDAG